MFDNRAVRNLMAERHGSKAAAWLLCQHRQQLREAGAIEFILPLGSTPPRWFRLAMVCLQRRRGWRVRTEATTRGHTWTVERLAHARFRYRGAYT